MWDMMTGSVTEMGEAYEREWARQWEVLNEDNEQAESA
jgi:hypothetical protein